MEVDSGADSVSSTPRATNKLTNDDNKSIVRLMCSFGGKIVPRPHDNQLRYVGGDTRIVAVHRTTTYNALIAKLSKLVNGIDFTVKYQLPNEDLDALITVSNDEDIDNMLDEFDRLTISSTTTTATTTTSNNNGNNYNNGGSSGSSRVMRLRLFLFSTSMSLDTDDIETNSRTSSIASLLDGSKKRESWFLDALNGGGAALERRRSEASSIVSEVPDYLFGLDNSDDTDKRVKSRSGLGDGVPGSDPGSPAFGSTSSASQLPTLPPVKTKLEGPNPGLNPGLSSGWGPGSNPGSPYPVHHQPQPQPGVQSIPVYYVPAGPGHQGPGVVPQRNSHLQPMPVPVQVQVPVQSHYVQQYGPGPVQVPVGYSGPGPVYGAGPFRPVEGMDPFVMQMQGNIGPGLGQVQGPSGVNQPLYYGVNKPGMDPSYPPGMVLPMTGEEMGGYGQPGLDAPKGRTMQP